MSSTDSIAPLPPGSWLGVVGGGQLGRMFCQAAQSLGYRVAVLDPAEDSPAAATADRHVQAAYDDVAALEQLGQLCQAVTTEFENVPADSFRLLAEHTRTSPAADAIAVVQSRITEKAFLRDRARVQVAPYVPVTDQDAIAGADEALFPGILKAARLGYDGKGQYTVNSREQAMDAWHTLGKVPCVLEARLPLAYEVSVVLARSFDGTVTCFTPVINQHREGILAVSTVRPRAETTMQPVFEQARQAASAIAVALDYVGVLCVEFFVLDGDTLVVNEVAPRPHNSGHCTMDACLVSQFEQQARIMAGLPAGCSAALHPVIMLNLLGDLWFDADGRYREPDWAGVLAIPGTKLYLYGKTQARPGRKMGHINILGSKLDEVHEAARRVATILGLDVQP